MVQFQYKNGKSKTSFDKISQSLTREIGNQNDHIALKFVRLPGNNVEWPENSERSENCAPLP